MNEIEKQFLSFYRAISNVSEVPIAVHKFNIAENKHSNALFFIPKKAPIDHNGQMKPKNIKVYIGGIEVEQSMEVVPEWLSFITGAIDLDPSLINQND